MALDFGIIVLILLLMNEFEFKSKDILWAAVFSSSTCNVTLAVGDCSQTYDLSYGVNKIYLELNSHNASGPVTVTMEKDKKVVINYTTSDFEYRQWTEQCLYFLLGYGTLYWVTDSFFLVC